MSLAKKIRKKMRQGEFEFLHWDRLRPRQKRKLTIEYENSFKAQRLRAAQLERTLWSALDQKRPG